jgi:hypothetical protein
MMDFGLALYLQLILAQEWFAQIAYLPNFWLALVCFLVVQSMYIRLQKKDLTW